MNYDAEIDRLQALAAENLPTGHAVRYRTELYELHSMPRPERAEYARRMEERIASSEHRGSALHYEAMRYLASVLLSEDPGSSLEIAERAGGRCRAVRFGPLADDRDPVHLCASVEPRRSGR
ncbi:MAG: hypothetical protein ACFHWZ_07035 [Phycisphaerales bacterium]